MQFETRTLPLCFVGVALTLLTTDCSIISARGDEKPGDDPYTSAWESLSELMRKREYATAASLLDSLADDPEFREHGAQIGADKEVVAGLQELEHVVHEQAAKLPTGTKLDIYGIEFSLVKYDENPTGDKLVLRSEASGKEYSKPIANLPSSTWMQLSESKLEAVKHPSLILGIFSAFDHSPDVKTARKLLNDAASQGADVTRWLTRLEEKAKRTDSGDDAKERKEEADLIVGQWRMSMKNHGRIFDLEFRANGTNVVNTFPKPPTKQPRRFLLPRSTRTSGNWTKDANGTYRVTLLGGTTLELRIFGDRLLGRNAAGGEVVGLRQVQSNSVSHSQSAK